MGIDPLVHPESAIRNMRGTSLLLALVLVVGMMVEATKLRPKGMKFLKLANMTISCVALALLIDQLTGLPKGELDGQLVPRRNKFDNMQIQIGSLRITISYKP